MSKDVSRRQAGTVSTSTPLDAGHGADIGTANFGGRALTYEEDIPTRFRHGAKDHGSLALAGSRAEGPSALVLASEITPPDEQHARRVERTRIASGARQLDKPRRFMGRIVQRRIGWLATPTEILVTTVERELSPRGDGKLAPAGDWLIEHRKTFSSANGTAVKRSGKVPITPPDEGPSNHQAQSSHPHHQDAFPEGEFALSFLPAPVRASAIARVPAPTVFDGTVIRVVSAETGKEEHREVNVLRMDTRSAVVIHAELKPRAHEWEVSQATYVLTAPRIEQA